MDANYRKPGLSIDEVFRTGETNQKDIELGMNMCNEHGFSDFYACFVSEADNKKYYNAYCKKCGWIDLVTPEQLREHVCK